MPDHLKQTRLETEAIVIGYAMSRLDTTYLRAHSCSTWKQAFLQAATALSVPPTSLKNLRDEFDPVHPNTRKGWHMRPLRPNRERVLQELREVSDEALLEMIQRILIGDEEAVVDAIDSLAGITRVVHNVAERLLTGRRAEDYFLANCQTIINVPSTDIVDFRQAARGFDFGVRSQPNWAVEVKGLKNARGGILFTDREWTEAKYRKANYFLVIVGNLIKDPISRVVRDPHSILQATCSYQTSITAVWRSTVSARQH